MTIAIVIYALTFIPTVMVGYVAFKKGDYLLHITMYAYIVFGMLYILRIEYDAVLGFVAWAIINFVTLFKLYKGLKDD